MASVFLVEDEVLIRMMVTDMLEELGHTIVAEAGDLASALKLATSANFDFAILDVSLGRDNSTPVAAALHARGIPFAFASGYASEGVPEEFRTRPRLNKPFQLDQLERCITQLLV
jgi:CheY-like chemotaxis protein